MITMIFQNLLMNVENFGKRLACDRELWLLQRLAGRMDHSRVEIRRQAIAFLTNLVDSVSGAHRDFVLEKLDVVRGCLYVLSREMVPSMILQHLTLLEYCLHLDSSKLTLNILQEETLSEEPHVCLNLRWLEYFFS